MTQKYFKGSLENIPHDSAVTHVTGETVFIDDILMLQNELYVGILTSKVAHGKILKINYDKALEVPDIDSIYTSKDLIVNKWGAISKDQPLLAKNKVLYFGEPIAVIASSSKSAIKEAKELIKIEYEELPALFTIDDAINNKVFFTEKTKLASGNLTLAKNKTSKTLKGVFKSGGQEHFYLESHAVITYPGEDGDILIQSSSQHPTEVQHVVAAALGLSFHQVVCTVKRMGGAFGGKESQASHIAALCALVTHNTKRAARLIFNKDEDMEITGKRHPFQTNYEVGFDNQGKLIYLEAALFSDGGAYLDLSPAILQRAMFHIDNAYFLPNCEITGQICKTNRSPNTAFRGFGGPQGAAVIEHIMEEIAQNLNIDAYQVRKINCYGIKENNMTHYGQLVENNFLPELFEKLHQKINYEEKINAIKKYNQENHSDIKGCSLTASKFGISFTAKFLNQGSALVNIHSDGTIQVSTGATEMGQGVNTKIQRIVSNALGISYKYVKLMPTSTEKNHNTSATAASSGSDINGAAALIATTKLIKRLRALAYQYFNNNPQGNFDEYIDQISQNTEHIIFKDNFISDGQSKITFPKLVQLAYLNRISLGGYGFYKTPEIYFDPKTGKGKPFLYYTNGVCYSEVSIDRFTGESKVLKTNILMDLGRPINKGIDFGQVAGAYIQAQGWVTNEELVYHKTGKLLAHSPTTYKIPNIQDTPREFSIDFIENNTNIHNVSKSKAVGEPPFLLGLAPFMAIKNAIYNLGKNQKTSNLKIPATSEEILRIIYPNEFGDISE